MADTSERGIQSDRELDRIVFFSDAVFAIAMTLLVLDIRVPYIPPGLEAQELPGQLLSLWPRYLSYVISFLVVLTYWMAHHSTFRTIRGYDRWLIWLNSLFSVCIAFLPFPSSLLGEYGNQQLAVAIWAGSMAVTRLPLTALFWYASGERRLVDTDMTPDTIRAFRIRGLVIPLVFLISIGISFFSLSAAMSSWVLLFVGDLVVLRMLRQ